MKYSGILRIGFKLLVNDKAKFSALLIGITFAVFLMMQMTAMFAGILTAPIRRSPISAPGCGSWTRRSIRPAVRFRCRLPAGRSAQHGWGQLCGAALYGGALVKLDSGTYQSVTVVGLDDTSLFGRPNSNRATFRISMPTTRSWWSTTLNSQSWRTRR